MLHHLPAGSLREAKLSWSFGVWTSPSVKPSKDTSIISRQAARWAWSEVRQMLLAVG